MSRIDIPKKVREFAGMAEALAGLVELADKANAWQQQEDEHRGRLAQLAKDETAARAILAAVATDIDRSKAEAAGLLELAKRDAEAIKADAVAEAEKITAAANEAVEAAKAKERRAEADQRKAEKELAEITQRAAVAGAELADINAKIAEASAELARAQADAARAKVKA